MVGGGGVSGGSAEGCVEVVVVRSEAALLRAVEKMVAVLDPDIIVGWDSSAGHLATFSSAHRT